MLATVCRYPAAVFFIIIISFFLSFKEVFTCILISPVPARALNKRAGVCDKVTTKGESHVGGACRPVSSGSSYMFSRACSASQTSVEDLVYPYILLIFGKNTSLAFCVSPVPTCASNKRAGKCDNMRIKDQAQVGRACRAVSSGSSDMYSCACSASQFTKQC
jgi:hypothetical protein